MIYLVNLFFCLNFMYGIIWTEWAFSPDAPSFWFLYLTVLRLCLCIPNLNFQFRIIWAFSLKNVSNAQSFCCWATYFSGVSQCYLPVVSSLSFISPVSHIHAPRVSVFVTPCRCTFCGMDFKWGYKGYILLWIFTVHLKVQAFKSVHVLWILWHPLCSNSMTLALCDYHPVPLSMAHAGWIQRVLLLGSFRFWLDLPSPEIWGGVG